MPQYLVEEEEFVRMETVLILDIKCTEFQDVLTIAQINVLCGINIIYISSEEMSHKLRGEGIENVNTYKVYGQH